MAVLYKAVSEQTAAGTLDGTELVSLVQGGNTRRSTAKTVANTADVLGAFTSGRHEPTTDDGAALGSTSKRWSDLFFASGAVVNFASGNVTITHSSNLLTISKAVTSAGVLTGAGVVSTAQVAAATTVTSSGATSGIGYATGAGGTVTQATSKSTGVTLDKVCGTITMHNAALAAGTTVGFTLTNSAIGADDVVVVNVKSGATANSYGLAVSAKAAGSCLIEIRNNTAGSLGEAVVLSFAVIKAVAA